MEWFAAYRVCACVTLQNKGKLYFRVVVPIYVPTSGCAWIPLAPYLLVLVLTDLLISAHLCDLSFNFPDF